LVNFVHATNAASHYALPLVWTASHVTEDVLHEREEVSDRAMMRALPEAERIKIQQQVQMFRIEKAKLDREVAKWDESGNDIIIVAKQMCMIMMEMTDFTRYCCCIIAIFSYYYWGLSAGYQPRPQVVDRGTTARYGGQLRYI